MEWVALLITVAFVANKLNGLKTVRLEWGIRIFHLEFDVKTTPKLVKTTHSRGKVG